MHPTCYALTGDRGHLTVPRFEAETHVGAEMEAVVRFHTDIQGLIELTPSVLNPRFEVIGGGDARLRPGKEFVLELTPMGVLPPIRHHARIVDITHDEDVVCILDELIDGPFETWIHRHLISETSQGTRIYDDIRYRVSSGGPLFTLGAHVGLKLLFTYRSARLKERFGPPEMTTQDG